MDAAATKPVGSAKDPVAEPGAGTSGRGGGPTRAFTEVREGMARFRAGQVARLAARERQGAAFSNLWPDFADRHGQPVQEAMTRFQPLILLTASLAATAALLMLLGTVGPALVAALDVGPAHAVALGAE